MVRARNGVVLGCHCCLHVKSRLRVSARYVRGREIIRRLRFFRGRCRRFLLLHRPLRFFWRLAAHPLLSGQTLLQRTEDLPVFQQCHQSRIETVGEGEVG